MYVTSFKKISQDLYHTVCRLDTNKFRNVAKFLCSLTIYRFYIVASIMSYKINPTNSNRIFIKILFQELTEYVQVSEL